MKYDKEYLMKLIDAVYDGLDEFKETLYSDKVDTALDELWFYAENGGEEK